MGTAALTHLDYASRQFIDFFKQNTQTQDSDLKEQIVNPILKYTQQNEKATFPITQYFFGKTLEAKEPINADVLLERNKKIKKYYDENQKTFDGFKVYFLLKLMNLESQDASVKQTRDFFINILLQSNSELDLYNFFKSMLFLRDKPQIKEIWNLLREAYKILKNPEFLTQDYRDNILTYLKSYEGDTRDFLKKFESSLSGFKTSFLKTFLYSNIDFSALEALRIKHVEYLSDKTKLNRENIIQLLSSYNAEINKTNNFFYRSALIKHFCNLVTELSSQGMLSQKGDKKYLRQKQKYENESVWSRIWNAFFSKKKVLHHSNKAVQDISVKLNEISKHKNVSVLEKQIKRDLDVEKDNITKEACQLIQETRSSEEDAGRILVSGDISKLEFDLQQVVIKFRLKKLEKEKYEFILTQPKLKEAYFSIHSSLSQFFIGIYAVGSGQVKESQTLATRAGNVFSQAMHAIPLAGAIISGVLSAGVDLVNEQHQKGKAEILAQYFANHKDAEKFARLLAIEIVMKGKAEIQNMSEGKEGIQKFSGNVFAAIIQAMLYDIAPDSQRDVSRTVSIILEKLGSKDLSKTHSLIEKLQKKLGYSSEEKQEESMQKISAALLIPFKAEPERLKLEKAENKIPEAPARQQQSVIALIQMQDQRLQEQQRQIEALSQQLEQFKQSQQQLQH